MTTGGRGAPQRAVWLTAVLLATRAAEASYDVRSVAAIIGGRPIVELNDHKKAVFVPIDTASVSQLGEANPSDRCITTACWAICHPQGARCRHNGRAAPRRAVLQDVAEGRRL